MEVISVSVFLVKLTFSIFGSANVPRKKQTEPRKKKQKTPGDILKERRRIRRKLMRQDKKKQRGLADAAKKHRAEKRVLKEENESEQDQAGPSLYDNLMRVVIFAAYYPFQVASRLICNQLEFRRAGHYVIAVLLCML